MGLAINARRSAGRWLTLPVLAWCTAAALLVLFAHLGGEIGEGETAGFDRRWLHAAQALRATSPWVSAVMRDWSGVGSTVVLTFVTLGACGYLLLTRAWRKALLMALAVATAAAVVHGLKLGFARGRPEPAFAEYAATGLIFPSGHASMTTVVFLTLALLLARSHARTAERVYLVGVAALLALLVGVSRAALGVHWATDVIGGWAFGIAWAAAWLLVANHIDPPRGFAMSGAEKAQRR